MFKFIEKLRNSDEDVKRRWMVVLTVISMAAVIYFWLAYFNNLVADLSGPPNGLAVDSAAGSASLTPNGEGLAASGFGFWRSMKNGVGIVYGGLLGGIRSLGRTLAEPREYVVPPSGNL